MSSKTSTDRIEKLVNLDAPRSRVWRALTDVKQFNAWFGSALTGTGGPVLLVPVLLALRVAPLKAVAVSQAAQLPVVVSGSVAYLQAGLTDLRLGTLLGVGAAAGTVVGALVATRLEPRRLRRLVALACIAAGTFIMVRTVG